MRGRKLRWTVAAGLVLLAGIAAVVLWPRPSRVTPENYERIRDGMTRAEVEAILGPPGNYTTAPVVYRFGANGTFPAPEGNPPPSIDNAAFWWSDVVVILVDFGEAGLVTRKYDFPAGFVEPDPVKNLLWRVKRQWRKLSP